MPSVPRPSERTGARAATGATQILLAESLLLPTGIVTAAFLTRTLGPADYGLFTLCATIVSWLGWFVAATLGRSTVKLISENPPREPERSPLVAALFRIHLVGAVGTFTLLFAGAGVVARGFGEPSLTPYLRLFAFEVLTFGLTVFHRDVLVGLGRFSERAKAAAVRWSLRLLLIVALVAAGLSVLGAILGSVLASAAEFAVARYYVRPSIRPRGPLPARLLPVVAPLVGYAIAMRLLTRLDLFMLKGLGGSASQAGYYGAAQNLTIAISLLTLAFSPALLTHLGTLRASGRRDEARRAAGLAVRFAFLLAPLAAAAAGARGEVVTLLFGGSFALSAPVFGVLLGAEVAYVMTSLATALLIAADRVGRVSLVGVGMLLCAVTAHLIVIPRYGMLGAAGVTAGVALGGALYSFLAAHSAWALRLPLATMLRSAALGVAAFAAGSIPCDPIALVVPKLAAIAVAVVLGFLALGEWSAEERRQLSGLFASFAPGAGRRE
jgi:O-antigen/teichoic acid export membrane protein